MSNRHDPFPMSSPEAERLAASVADETQPSAGTAASSSWTHMDTRTATRTSKITGTEEGDASQGLVGKKNKKKKKKKRSKAVADANKDHDDEEEDDGINIVEQDDDDDDDDEDDFLDRPLWESRMREQGGLSASVLLPVLRGAEKMYKRLYGDKLPVSEMLRTLCLASTLFFMIGGYWLLRSLKDPVLTALCGVSVIPKAKMLSVLVVLGVVTIYNHFLDSDMPKHKLFYLFGTFYFGLFLCISLLLMHPTIGLQNQQADPWRVLGWISYCSIESFGSVMVSLFWSFANSNISLETAKSSYGVMVATAQIGSILGPTFVNQFAKTWGPAKIYVVGALCMLLLQGTMYTYIRIYGSNEEREKAKEAAESSGPPKKKEPAGILEGLRLFYKYNYVKGIFAISALFMVEVTIVDYTMKVLARDFFAEEHPCELGMSCYDAINGQHGMSEDATAAFTTFMGFFGQATNTLSFLLSLLGTSAVIRYLGLRLTLLLFPTLCLIVIIIVRLHPTLYVVFAAMMMLKANSYALNNPTKEILYQPTSAAVKYKAKSWIDIFGARGAKALGSVVTNAFSDSAANLVANGSLVGMAVASFLIWNARFMGAKFDEYTESGYIVGDGDSSKMTNEETNVEMASAQNEVADTSCAIHDDDELGPEEEGQSESEHSQDDETRPKVEMV